MHANKLIDTSYNDEILTVGHEKFAFKEIIVCLFDGDYNLGFAALINSLTKSGFKGLICIGYRGDLPPWVPQLEMIDENHFRVNNDIIINFRLVNTYLHLGYYKPFFIKETFDYYKHTNKIYYFDVDIVVKAPWSYFSTWLEDGLCVCLDSSFHFLHNSHPWRKQWRKLAPEDDANFNNINYYFNSGFLGIERKSIDLIDKWIYYTQKYIEMGGNTSRFVKDEHNHLKGDQDLLNAAITVSPDIEISIVGKEGMGFSGTATMMDHAIGDEKPWKNHFFRQLIVSGKKPNLADKSFFLIAVIPLAFSRFTNISLRNLICLLLLYLVAF